MAGSTSPVGVLRAQHTHSLACSGHSVGKRNHGQPTLDVAIVLVRYRALSCSTAHDFLVRCIIASSTPALLPLFRATVLKALLPLTIILVCFNILNLINLRAKPDTAHDRAGRSCRRWLRCGR